MKTLDTKLKDNYRRRLQKALKGHERTIKAHDLLGCTLKTFKKHLEAQFLDNMCWDNYGEWHIDHIKPLMNFNMKRIGEQRRAFHYKNTRPLWADDNRKRKKKCVPTQD